MRVSAFAMWQLRLVAAGREERFLIEFFDTAGTDGPGQWICDGLPRTEMAARAFAACNGVSAAAFDEALARERATGTTAQT